MKRPVIKDAALKSYVEDIEMRLEIYEKSPYVNTYITLINQLNDFNNQLTIREVEIEEEGVKKNVTIGRIDLFGSKDEKEFERGFKYMIQVNELIENIEQIRKKMSVDEKNEANKILKDDSVESRIFKTNGAA